MIRDLKEIFASLYDIRFSKFATTMLTKLIYGIIVIAGPIVVAYAIATSFGADISDNFQSIAAILIAYFLVMLFCRIFLEKIIVSFQDVENSNELIKQNQKILELQEKNNEILNEIRNELKRTAEKNT